MKQPSIELAGVVLALVAASCTSAPTVAHPNRPVEVIQPASGAVAERDFAAEGKRILRAQFAAHRAQQIERLEDYSRAGAFPHNATTAPSLHVFRDPAGRLCAVANLVHQDGRDDLVEATVRDHNELAVADVHGGPMAGWISTSGLTQEELVRIQLPAPLMESADSRPRERKAVATRDPLRFSLTIPRRAGQVAPPSVRKGLTEEQMIAAVRTHLGEVELALRADAESSLDVAVARYQAERHEPPTAGERLALRATALPAAGGTARAVPLTHL